MVLPAKKAGFMTYFGVNSSQNPYTTSADSYKKYSVLKLRNFGVAKLQNFKMLECGM
jgi:hypothetical protein